MKSLFWINWDTSLKHQEHGINVIEEIRQPKTHVMFHSVMFQLNWYASTVTQNWKGWKNPSKFELKQNVKNILTYESHNTCKSGKQGWNKLTTKRDWITMRQRFSTFNLQGTEESNEVVEKTDANDPANEEFQTTHQDRWGYVPEVPPNRRRCHCHCLEKSSSSFSTLLTLSLTFALSWVLTVHWLLECCVRL